MPHHLTSQQFHSPNTMRPIQYLSVCSPTERSICDCPHHICSAFPPHFLVRCIHFLSMQNLSCSLLSLDMLNNTFCLFTLRPQKAISLKTEGYCCRLKSLNRAWCMGSTDIRGVWLKGSSPVLAQSKLDVAVLRLCLVKSIMEEGKKRNHRGRTPLRDINEAIRVIAMCFMDTVLADWQSDLV